MGGRGAGADRHTPRAGQSAKLTFSLSSDCLGIVYILRYTLTAQLTPRQDAAARGSADVGGPYGLSLNYTCYAQTVAKYCV